MSFPELVDGCGVYEPEIPTPTDRVRVCDIAHPFIVVRTRVMNSLLITIITSLTAYYWTRVH